MFSKLFRKLLKGISKNVVKMRLNFCQSNYYMCTEGTYLQPRLELPNVLMTLKMVLATLTSARFLSMREIHVDLAPPARSCKKKREAFARRAPPPAR